MSGDGRPLSVRLHEKAGHLEAFAPATAQDFHELADEVAALEAAPSCACEGREPIWDGHATVCEVRGEKAYVDTVYIRISGQGLKEGQKLEVYVFLPTKEEAAPCSLPIS